MKTGQLRVMTFNLVALEHASGSARQKVVRRDVLAQEHHPRRGPRLA